ncbi:DUF551 domain-containing protein [Enterobacter hormaechei]|uniref:DUF551 domain-containing protein n=1 Tax=Enterobacter hormaechei TaxID=158836 RepID=UPI001F2226CA|nr:DUF551 domain-containing protein [Enterobacter hormaechei]
MSAITKDQAKDLRNAFQCWQQDYDPAEDKEQYDMFGLGIVAMDALLESLEAEPVAYTDAEELRFPNATSDMWLAPLGHGWDLPLYTAPPAPVMPDEAINRAVDEIMATYAGSADECRKLVRKHIEDACRAAMLQGVAGNSPVIPDGWVDCSERMPDKLIPVMVMYADGEMWSALWTGTKWDDGTEFPDPHPVTHWQEMPAAPQQEAE